LGFIVALDFLLLKDDNIGRKFVTDYK
jgi:hypothetical protein